VEGLNGADAASKPDGARGKKPGIPMLNAIVEATGSRFQGRLEGSQKCTEALPPRVRTHLQKKLEGFKTSTLTSVKFTDDKREKGTVFIGPSRFSRKFALGDSPCCECGGPDVDDEPCACLLLAAENAGYAWVGLVSEFDSAANWKKQYSGLPEFRVPGTDQLKYLQFDASLRAPVMYSTPRGRPSLKRKKSIIESYSKHKKAVKTAASMAAFFDAE
jgi:hypothetical protein